jgi:anthranilate/para-aminobenzoate synthase component I
MRPLIQEIPTVHTPESLAGQLGGEDGIVLLRSSSFDSPQARYSFITAKPFLTFRSSGSRCEISRPRSPDPGPELQFGNPWHILDALMSRCELLDEIDSPFPLGGAFGYWGYDLKNFTEPKLPRRAVNDLELPDCHVGFYDSLVVFDHRLGKVCIVSTGLNDDGSRSEARAKEKLEFWKSQLTKTLTPALSLFERATGKSFPRPANPHTSGSRETLEQVLPLLGERVGVRADASSNIFRADFIAAVARAQRYIHAGDIYAMVPAGNYFRD